jgi:hypothetical protein
MRILLAVLASIWFMPVSCTVFMTIGAEVLVAQDARDAAKGDSVHSSIAVLAVPAPGEAIAHMLLGRVPDYKEQHPQASFLMPAKEGKITPSEGTSVSYQVAAEAGGEQTIETQYQDGDRAAWGRYRAGKRDVTPLASRLSLSDYLFYVVPFAILLAIALYVGARIARGRLRRESPPAT